jgi:undecaprenyl-diphosphatase
VNVDDSFIAFVLGIVQGVTEFLPVSSSGHLRLAGAAFGMEDTDTLFDVAVHAGTLGAILAVYRSEVWRIVAGLGRPSWSNPGFRLGVLLLVGTLPVGVIGVLLGDWMEDRLTSVPWVGALLLVNGVILMASRGRGEGGRGLDELTVRDALIIGAVQSIALLRGISRSGITITVGMLRGANREAAATFGFLLAIPAILGAVVLQLSKAVVEGGVPMGPLAIGTLAAAGSGYLALVGLIRLVRRGRLHHFAWYCWALGLTAVLGWAIG